VSMWLRWGYRLWAPHAFLSNGYQGLSPNVKRPEREANHSLPHSAEVKIVCGAISPLPYTFSWHDA